MTPTELNRVLTRALREAVADGELPPSVAEPPGRVTLRDPPHGEADFASNLALRLAPAAGRPARRIAEILRIRLAQEPGIRRVEVAGPGFLNLTLRESAQAAQVRRILMETGDNVPGARGGSLPEDPVRDAARWSQVTGQPISYERREHVPLFRVQYARSRGHALTVGAQALGFSAEPGSYRRRAEVALLSSLVDAPRVRAAAGEWCPDAPARTGSPTDRVDPAVTRLARHLQRVADAFLDFTTAPGSPAVLPQGDQKPEAAHRSRLALAEAAGLVLAGGLTQLGISAPHHL